MRESCSILVNNYAITIICNSICCKIAATTLSIQSLEPISNFFPPPFSLPLAHLNYSPIYISWSGLGEQKHTKFHTLVHHTQLQIRKKQNQRFHLEIDLESFLHGFSFRDHRKKRYTLICSMTHFSNASDRTLNVPIFQIYLS